MALLGAGLRAAVAHRSKVSARLGDCGEHGAGC